MRATFPAFLRLPDMLLLLELLFDKMGVGISLKITTLLFTSEDVSLLVGFVSELASIEEAFACPKLTTKKRRINSWDRFILTDSVFQK